MIVDMAMQLLNRHGLKAVTIRRVAARLGVGAMTLYTYLDGQDGLRREMVRRGFDMLHAHCVSSSTLDTLGDWRGGAEAYLRFATEHPKLYQLMFETPLPPSDADLLHGGFQPLLDKITQRLADRGFAGEDLARAARRDAGRYWIALHGLACILISGREVVLEGDLDALLTDLLEHNAPL